MNLSLVKDENDTWEKNENTVYLKELRLLFTAFYSQFIFHS